MLLSKQAHPGTQPYQIEEDPAADPRCSSILLPQNTGQFLQPSHRFCTVFTQAKALLSSLGILPYSVRLHKLSFSLKKQDPVHMYAFV